MATHYERDDYDDRRRYRPSAGEQAIAALGSILHTGFVIVMAAIIAVAGTVLAVRAFAGVDLIYFVHDYKANLAGAAATATAEAGRGGGLTLDQPRQTAQPFSGNAPVSAQEAPGAEAPPVVLAPPDPPAGAPAVQPQGLIAPPVEAQPTPADYVMAGPTKIPASYAPPSGTGTRSGGSWGDEEQTP